MTGIQTQENNPFESIKELNEHGAEYWSARDLMTGLGYGKWSNFQNAIKKAIKSCENSGNQSEYHFADTGKMVATGSGAKRKVKDVHLSRFACYLIAQNGDSAKSEIARAQEYFAIQTRKQELSDEVTKAQERIEIRQQCSAEYKALSGVARKAGVQDSMFGIFHDAGYKGMYGGLGISAIKRKKGIDKKEVPFDRMGTTELAANAFRLTQTRDKLQRDGVADQDQAITLHGEVGKEVRDAIRKIGGTMPEDIPAVEHIRVTKKRVKQAVPKLELEADDARGLVGEDDITFDDI